MTYRYVFIYTNKVVDLTSYKNFFLYTTFCVHFLYFCV